jgi:putative tryptophan/tyrosine transport system substrate-binding protein
VIGVLVNPNDPITTNSETNDMRAAARSVGQRIEILQASTAHDIETAFASLIGMQVGALLVAPDPVFVTEANQLVALARAIQYPRCIGEARLPKPAADELRNEP